MVVMGGFDGENMASAEVLDLDGLGCDAVSLPDMPVATNWNLGVRAAEQSRYRTIVLLCCNDDAIIEPINKV